MCNWTLGWCSGAPINYVDELGLLLHLIGIVVALAPLRIEHIYSKTYVMISLLSNIHEVIEERSEYNPSLIIVNTLEQGNL